MPSCCAEALDAAGVEFLAQGLKDFPERPTGGAMLAVLEHARLSSQDGGPSKLADRRRLVEVEFYPFPFPSAVN